MCSSDLAAAVLSLSCIDAALAVQTTQPGKVTRVISSWTNDAMMVTIAAPGINPSGCPTADGYNTKGGAAGRLQQSIILTALSNDLPIALDIDGCSEGRPAILGVRTPTN